MIAPDVAEGSNRQTPLRTLLGRNLAASALVFLLLECWRPYFFQTDDNLDGGYPFFMEMGRHLAQGRSPFFSDHLFGGHYEWLRDPGFFCWHPLYLAVSLLSVTPLHLVILDLAAFVLFMLTTAGFVALAHHLRRAEGVRFGDGWLMFLALSFVYSVYAMATAASWLNFAANQSAQPWLALGLLLRDGRRSFGVIALFALHQILGGHLSPTISSSLIFSLFALGIAVQRRSWQPLVCWGAGNLVAILLALPFLYPALQGFGESVRSHGISVEDMQANNFPLSQFPLGFFFGMALWLVHPHSQDVHGTYILALASAAATWCLLPALAGRGRWRGLDVVCLGMIFFSGFLVCRPLWVVQLMSHLPLLRSLRWPFRELMQFEFFLHLFLLLRRPGFSLPLRRSIVASGVAVFILPIFAALPPPTFNPMSWDRRLVLSGRDQVYWTQVRAFLQPRDVVAVLIPKAVYDSDRFGIPYSLLGTYNYSCIDGTVNASGYTSTVPVSQRYSRIGYYPFGAYIPEQRAALAREHPDLKFITLASLEPLKITLGAATGPEIDLTPFVPHEMDPK